MEKIAAGVSQNAGLARSGQDVEAVHASGVYTVECRGADGALKWSDEIKNLVTTVGKNDLLDKYLAGSAYTASLKLGLKGAGTAVIGDTMASHASWAEITAYSGTRATPAFSAASAGSKATSSAASFSINGTATVAGCFLVSGGSATISDTSGILYSAGDFTGGSRSVVNGDSLSVTYTASA